MLGHSALLLSQALAPLPAVCPNRTTLLRRRNHFPSSRTPLLCCNTRESRWSLPSFVKAEQRMASSRARSATTAFTGTLKLTGIVIKSDPRGSYKPSRLIDLIVDGEPKTAVFQLRETQTTLTWEVKPAVVITAKSIISIQPYEARTLIRRKKAEGITIQGEAVFRFCSSRPGDKHDFERVCAGFRVVISVVGEKDFKARDKTRTGREGRAVSSGEHGQDVFFGPSTAPNSFKRSLDSLRDLMVLIPSDSALYETARETRDALRTACGFMPTDDVDADVQNLGEQVHDTLVEMQLPKFSERLASQSLTITYLLNLIGNAALFAEDCSKLEFKEFGTVDNRRNTLGDFDRQFAILRRNFTSGKQTYYWNPSYTRPQLPTPPPPPPPVEEDARSEASTVEPEPDTRTVVVDEDQMLQDTLYPDFTTSDHLNLCCLDLTRKGLLSSITAWLDDIAEPNVLWLCGAPGTGKTAIAWSLVAELERQQRSAGEFFFRPTQNWPSQLWCTLAYRMAKFHPAIKSEVYKALKREESYFPRDDIQLTFDQLIAGPLKCLATRLSSRSPVVLIDGLDQCTQGYSNWQALLDTLPQWLNLPRHYKLIIIGRPQHDIAKVFEGKDIKRMELLVGEDADYYTHDDVRTYLNYRFAEMRKQDKSISEYWPDYDAISKLVTHTSGFFKWAALAVDAIQDEGDRERHLTTIIESGTTTTFDSFDQYLEGILRMVFDNYSSDAFRATMGTIALSKQPLTMEDLEHFLQHRFPSPSEVSLEDLCSRLLPIISIEGENNTIKIRHKAYKDYLIDSKRCTLRGDVFFIDRSKAHRKMTISCLRIMQQGLKFNICGLKSSYMMNDQVEDKSTLVNRCIPSYLAYACQYWADHLRGIASSEKRDTDIVNLLRNFLNFHLLYWLEALSLLSRSHIASKSLLIAAEWLEATDKDLSLTALDASRFSLTFADVISASAPHIYLSALPFAPPSSLVSKRYRDQFPRTIKVLHEEGTKWPAMRFSVSLDYYVYAVSVHPDGRRVAAATSGSTALVISVATGDTLFNLAGHGGSVRAIAYAASGKRIATGCDDRRLRIYEAENGSLLFGPFELHSDWIRSVSWSPDGQRIVTGSDDRKVKVVAAETGQVIYDTAFHDDWIRTVVFTSEFFISGSDDRTVRIYDASTGTASGEAWSTGQTGYIRAVAMSPDNKILAAGSDDYSIMLYNMDTRSAINQPIRGHNGAIRSLAFSKDGQLLVSGSEDSTVRLWNVRTGKKLCDPLYGHMSSVSSVRFSPDMKQLITGGEDCSIRFFDMDSLPVWKNSSGVTGTFRAAIPLDDGKTILASDGSSISRWTVDVGRVENVAFEGDSEHLSDIQSASISPNGRLVATAARNRTVMIWQADSGKALWGPLEGHGDDIYALSFSADSKMVVSGSDDRNVWIWSAETGQSICGPMEGHTSSVKGVCFSPDGKQVASGSNDNNAIIWSVESGEKVHEPLTHHRDWIFSLAYSPNGLYLATASDDYTVAIWDVTTGERVFHTLTGHGGWVRLVNWSPDSKRIVTAALDNVIRIFDIETGILLCEPLIAHKSNLTALSMRPSLYSDDPEVVSASLDGTVRLWGLRMKKFVKTQTCSGYHSDWVHTIAFSPVDDHIASGGDDGRLVVMDVVTGQSKLNINAHQDWIRCVAYSPDGKKIATCSDDHIISIWDAENGERLLEPLEGHTGVVMSIEFSPGGGFLVSGSMDGTIRTWDLHPSFIKLNNPLCIYRGHKSAVNAVAYASGGEFIVSGSANAEIAVWEGDLSDKCLRQFSGHGGAVLSIRVFDDKIFSSSEDRTIRIWELSTGHALRSIFNGHTGPINSIALTPGGNRIVSASDDASLRIFDSETGEPCTLPLRMSERMFAVTVSHDGALVACSGADSSVHVWRANMAQRAVWPDNFIRKARGLEFCLVDEQGFLADFTPPDDGWLRGSTNEPMCWIPSFYRAGLWTPRTVGILGALETIIDLRSFVHGTNWEECRAYVFADKA